MVIINFNNPFKTLIMKLRNYFSSILTVVMMLCSLVFVCSCGDDKDDTPVTTGNIHGYVTDYANANAPIAGATVTLNIKGLAKSTGSDGRFEFTNIEAGTYTLQVMANNYQTTTKQVTVVAGQYANCDFQLKENAVTVSPTNLSFGKDVNTMSITIRNNGANQQSYNISNFPAYLELSSESGFVPANGNELIMVTVKQRYERNQNTQIKVTVGTESIPVNIIVQGTNDTDINNNSGGGGGNNGGEQPSTPTVNDVTRGLLSYYTFDDGTAKNLKDATNNGTVYGSNSTYITDTPNGKGKALSLANHEYVNIPKNVVEGAGAFSISMWVKDFGAGPLFISTFVDDTFNGSPRLYIDDSNYFVADGTEEIYNTAVRFGLSANNYQSSGWHMITATFANRKINLYIDGSLVGNVSHDSKTKGHGNKTCIGGVAQNIQNNAMKVDNVRVYSVALTDTEVANLYEYERQ